MTNSSFEFEPKAPTRIAVRPFKGTLPSEQEIDFYATLARTARRTVCYVKPNCPMTRTSIRYIKVRSGQYLTVADRKRIVENVRKREPDAWVFGEDPADPLRRT